MHGTARVLKDCNWESLTGKMERFDTSMGKPG